MRCGYICRDETRRLRSVDHALFRAGKNLGIALAAARENFSSPAAKVLLDFVAAAKRGVCADAGVGGRFFTSTVVTIFATGGSFLVRA